ncbi:hypothetical protein GH810_14510 [Acetobacterium paludosum]|uniref:Uncharacterized protein n=1 Tax=Acetobacterium paludosum TaxID=52693 RepID=A0A923HVY6_9FIRM|nr:hypothetical protein [Acetobacterium paludosum]MBC3889523.1 hypothetical protein [Acetobacterium paludosum]
MKQKHIIQVETIKYQGAELPVLITLNSKSYLITEILKEETNTVFPGGGVGSKYTILINMKETAVYHDKHNLKWYAYIEGPDPETFKSKDDQLMDADDFRFLG